MTKEQDLLKVLRKIRSEIGIKITILHENPDTRYPKSFIAGMECAFLESISCIDIISSEFFDKG